MTVEEMGNCKKCGNLFPYNGFSNVCIHCFEAEEAQFSKIREYLLAHPHAKIFEVSVNLEISLNTIKRYLREGRLEIIEKANLFLGCEICGKPIQSGKYCDACSKQANHDFKVIYEGTPSVSGANKINYISSKNRQLKSAATR